MTIVFTGLLADHLIVMTVDSAVTLDFEDSPREYDKGRKAYCFPGVGCVTTWGARDHNRVGEFLDRQEISAHSHSVNDLADLVWQYLTEHYRPRELNLDDVGYHVAGFNRDGRARLYHVFWGFDRPRPPQQTCREYKRYDHTPPAGGIQLLYNGRNDLAHVVVQTLVDEVKKGGDPRFDVRTSVGLACFGDFVARFAAELTREVGPPFLTWLISPRNQVEWIKNDKLCPVSRDKVCKSLRA